MTRVGILEKAREPVLPGDEQDALAWIWVEVREAARPGCWTSRIASGNASARRVCHFEEATLAAIRDLVRTDTPSAEWAIRAKPSSARAKEHRERERVVAVPQLACKQR